MVVHCSAAEGALVCKLFISPVLFGVCCELLATLLGTFGKQLVSYSGKIACKRKACCASAVGLTTTTVFGPLLDAAAYAFAPQALVAPLNSLDLVWNVCTAPFTLGEQVSPLHIVGTALVTIGSTLSSVFGPHHKEHPTLESVRVTFSSTAFFVYLIVLACILIGSAMVLRHRPVGVRDWMRGTVLATTAGCLAGSVFFMTESLGLLMRTISRGEWSIWHHWLPWVVVLCSIIAAVGNMPFMVPALKEYEALFVIPVFAGCQIITACITAATILQQKQLGVAYWLSIMLIMFGLGFLVVHGISMQIDVQRVQVEDEEPRERERTSRSCTEDSVTHSCNGDEENGGKAQTFGEQISDHLASKVEWGRSGRRPSQGNYSSPNGTVYPPRSLEAPLLDGQILDMKGSPSLP